MFFLFIWKTQHARDCGELLNWYYIENDTEQASCIDFHNTVMQDYMKN